MIFLTEMLLYCQKGEILLKRAVVFIFVLFLTASMLTSCVNVSSGTPDPSEKAEYLSWNRAEWESADDAEKVKCTAVLLSYITELSGENNVLVEKILALGAPELVDDVGNYFTVLEEYEIDSIKEIAEWIYEVTLSEESEARLADYSEKSAANDYINWTKEEWNSADEIGKTYCAASYLIYMNELDSTGEPQSKEDADLNAKISLWAAGKVIQALEKFFKIQKETNLVTVKDFADYAYEMSSR